MTTPLRSIRLIPKDTSELERSSGEPGEIFIDKSDLTLKIFDGRTRGGVALLKADLSNIEGNAGVAVSDTPPPAVYSGTLWFNSQSGGLFVYYKDGNSDQWIQPVIPVGVTGTGGSGGSYILPTATAETLGGIKVGNRLTISNGVLSAIDQSYTLPAASPTILGGIRVGNRLTITNGVLSADAQTYTLPTASTTVLGGVKVDGTTISIADGVISSTGLGSLPTASTTVLGAVKIDGTTITITDGVISSSGGASYNQSLNTTDNVTFNTVTASTLTSVGTGTPTYTSSGDFIFDANSGTGVLQVTGSVSATKVLTLTPQNSAPIATAGSFAVANGTGWDPASKGSGPYPVFYNGTSWTALY